MPVDICTVVATTSPSLAKNECQSWESNLRTASEYVTVHVFAFVARVEPRPAAIFLRHHSFELCFTSDLDDHVSITLSLPRISQPTNTKTG